MVLTSIPHSWGVFQGRRAARRAVGAVAGFSFPQEGEKTVDKQSNAMLTTQFAP
jgi:hypothetical protein